MTGQSRAGFGSRTDAGQHGRAVGADDGWGTARHGASTRWRARRGPLRGVRHTPVGRLAMLIDDDKTSPVLAARWPCGARIMACPSAWPVPVTDSPSDCRTIDSPGCWICTTVPGSGETWWCWCPVAMTSQDRGIAKGASASRTRVGSKASLLEKGSLTGTLVRHVCGGVRCSSVNCRAVRIERREVYLGCRKRPCSGHPCGGSSYHTYSRQLGAPWFTQRMICPGVSPFTGITSVSAGTNPAGNADNGTFDGTDKPTEGQAFASG